MRLKNSFLLVSLLTTIQLNSAGPQDIAVIGTGYVGLVLGAALAEFGHNVTCLDVIETKINKLKQGEIPIYEPGLDALVYRNVAEGRLVFSTDVKGGIQANDAIFIAVGTPTGDEGRADMRYVESVVHTIAENINGYKLICTKSTVPIGTGKNIVQRIMKEHQVSHPYDVASNPEFLREGSAVQDFLVPDRVVIGVDSPRAENMLRDIYAPLIEKGYPFLVTNIPTAEAIKYASNAFLATKISYINEMANLCDVVGADVKYVAAGMGLDSRIGKAFLYPGPGYGGSCFPKDTQALLFTAEANDVRLDIVKAAIDANKHQKYRVLKKFMRLMNNNVSKKTIAILGLAFKANTDDIRYSPAINVMQELLANGAIIKAYDPQAADNMKTLFPTITYCDSVEQTLQGADAAIVLTEWADIANFDLVQMKSLLKNPILMDARNLYEPAKLRELGFIFDNIGRANA